MILFLISILSTLSVTKATNTTWIELGNKYISGHDVVNWTATRFNTSENCQKACDATLTCKSILYATGDNIIGEYNGFCWLKTADLTDLKLMVNVTSGFDIFVRNGTAPTPTPPQPNQNVTWILLKDKYISGHPVKNWTISRFDTPHHCQMACDATPDCKSIMYATE